MVDRMSVLPVRPGTGTIQLDRPAASVDSSQALAASAVLIMICAVLLLFLPGLGNRQKTFEETHRTNKNVYAPMEERVRAALAVQSSDVTLAGAGTEAYDAEAGTARTAADNSMDGLLGTVTGQILRTAAVYQGEKTGLAASGAAAGAAAGADAERSAALDSASAVSYAGFQTVAGNTRMSWTDYQTLLQITEAECTGGDEKSKLLVANVVLNRVADERFPDTVYEVVWQRLNGEAQFSPTQDGRMGTLPISETTERAVKRAVEGENISEGALFFLARSSASKKNAEWFDSKLTYLYSYGGHEFFRFR